MQIGSESTEGLYAPMIYGVYHGPDLSLLGKSALLIEKPSPDEPAKVIAQFDDTTTGRGYGWWPFTRDQFTLYSRYRWKAGAL